jgi:hypothetical protein
MDFHELAGKLFGMGKAHGIGDFRNAFISAQAVLAFDGPGLHQPLFGGDPQGPEELASKAPDAAMQPIRQAVHPEARGFRVLEQASQIPMILAPYSRPTAAGRMRNDLWMTAMVHGRIEYGTGQQPRHGRQRRLRLTHAPSRQRGYPESSDGSSMRFH